MMHGKLKLGKDNVILECYSNNILSKSFDDFSTVGEALDFVENRTKNIDSVELYSIPDFDFDDSIIDECLHIEFIPLLDEDYLFEMARIPKRYTGLDYDIWLDPMGADRQNTHNVPRLKIYVDRNTLVPITISGNPDIPESVKKNMKVKIQGLSKIKQFIIKNQLFLLMHYYRQLDDVQISLLMKNLNKIPSADDMNPAEVIDLVDEL